VSIPIRVDLQELGRVIKEMRSLYASGRTCQQTAFEDRVVNVNQHRISIPEIAKSLSIGRFAVYSMLEQGILPGVRLGPRWIVTRHACEQWERTCGTTGFQRQVGANV
jgi:excisionase family DNA binding protein